MYEGESYAGRLPEDVVPDTDPEWMEAIGTANGAKMDDSGKPKKFTPNASEQDGAHDVEHQESEELAFNLIQAIFVPRIIRKVDEICRKECYGCNLPQAKEVTQRNHECLMDAMPEKVARYFKDALREIVDRELSKCRMDWNIQASGNKKISTHFPTISDTNRVFDKYVAMHVKRTALVEEEKQNVLFDICVSDCEQYQYDH